MTKIKPGKNSTKKELIIQKASALFKKKGYSATSMRELAESVGVEAPSLYNHIGSKSELLQAICFNVGHRFTDQIEKVEKGTESITAKIEAIRTSIIK